jgi:8-amino-7-oxononanoate synthase
VIPDHVLDAAGPADARGVAVDATSALFLGLRHPTAALRPWRSLTTGVPGALREAPAARRVAALVAAGQGAPAGLVARSALHALVDVLGGLPVRGDVVALDSACYPLARWASLLARQRGARVTTYPHHRPDLVPAPRHGRLFVVTDGWCPGCRRAAPLARLREAARAHGGVLVVDDSLAYGVLGARKPGEGFGDGTGTPRWCGIDHRDVLWVASLAKAHGAPLAVVTGAADVLAPLAECGHTRVHASPPSAADLAAAERALTDPTTDRARRRLLRHVRRVQRALDDTDPPFPIADTWFPTTGQAHRQHARMLAHGVRAVVQRPRCLPGALVSAMIRADHTDHDIELIASALRATRDRRTAS